MKRLLIYGGHLYCEYKTYQKILKHHTKGLIQLLYLLDTNQIELSLMYPLDAEVCCYSIKEQENRTARFESSMVAVPDTFSHLTILSKI